MMIVEMFIRLIPGGACTYALVGIKISAPNMTNNMVFQQTPLHWESKAVIGAQIETKTHDPGSPGKFVSSKQKDIDAETTGKRDL